MEQLTKDKVAMDIEAIAVIRDRLKWIQSTPLSCDIDTIGECKAFMDAVHAIVGTEIDVLGEMIEDLKNLLDINEGGTA